MSNAQPQNDAGGPQDLPGTDQKFYLSAGQGKRIAYTFAQIEKMRAKDLDELVASGSWDLLGVEDKKMYEPGYEHVIAYGRYLERYHAPNEERS